MYGTSKLLLGTTTPDAEPIEKQQQIVIKCVPRTVSDRALPVLQHALVRSCRLSLHFGWITCAALVNLNKYIGGVSRFSNNVKFAFSMVSIAIAVLLAVGVTAKTGDPVYAAVVAWALLAVAGKGGAENMEVRRNGGIPVERSPLDDLVRGVETACVLLRAREDPVAR